MKPSIATSAAMVTRVTAPKKNSHLASLRRNRRQLVTQMVAAGLAAPAAASVLSRTTAAQEATPAGEERDWCAEAMAAATPAAGAEATPTAEQCVAIESYDIYFEPNLVTIPADTPVTIALPNEGAILHNFSLDEHNNPELPIEPIDVDIEPGALESTTVELPEGTYYFYCDVPGHEAAGMFGYLNVEVDAEISAESATVTPPAG